jgi:hypothetical protein
MRAGEVEAVLRRIGWVFILGLVLQPRISGQAVLLPVFGALMIWALFGLDPVATSPEARRGLRSTAGAAAVVTLLGVAGWLGAEPGALSLFVLLAFVTGVLLYAAFLQRWCMRYDWLEAAEHLRRSRLNLIGVSVTTALALAAVVVFADRPLPGAPDPDWWNLVAGRTVSNPWVIGFFVLVFIGWIGACIELERGSKAVRAKLAEHPDASAPSA